MKKAWIFLSWVTLLIPVRDLAAQSPNAGEDVHSVASSWAGVRLQIYHFEKIGEDRLLVGVRVYGTAQTPAQGVLIGERPAIPAGATAQMIASTLYDYRPFSFAAAIMTDEESGESFKTVPAASQGPRYLPPFLLARIHPGEVKVITLEFPVPPPPASGDVTQQTVSIQLPSAKGPIRDLKIPNSVPSAASP